MEFQFWYWFLIGILLLGLELVAPAFVALCFGLGAIVIGILVWLFPSWSVAGQLLTWSIMSALAAFLMFRYVKPIKGKPLQQLSREAVIGQVGILTKIPEEGVSGVVRFSLPVLGADEWLCRSEESLMLGQRVQVVEILGNELVVKTLS